MTIHPANVRYGSVRPLTVATTLATIRALGLSARLTEYGEYRVTLKGVAPERAETVAYYTNDAEDAIGTARLMAMADKLAQDKGYDR